MKLKALESNYPCICGHAEKHHGVSMEEHMCYSCWVSLPVLRSTYRHEFKADNLRYLEEVSKNG